MGHPTLHRTLHPTLQHFTQSGKHWQYRSCTVRRWYVTNPRGPELPHRAGTLHHNGATRHRQTESRCEGWGAGMLADRGRVGESRRTGPRCKPQMLGPTGWYRDCCGSYGGWTYDESPVKGYGGEVSTGDWWLVTWQGPGNMLFNLSQNVLPNHTGKFVIHPPKIYASNFFSNFCTPVRGLVHLRCATEIHAWRISKARCILFSILIAFYFSASDYMLLQLRLL